MTPGLLFPAALAALVALALPLLIHLARRAEVRPVDFAALRWLAARPRPRTRLRFDEWLLLAVRLLLLVLVAVWLARPVIAGLRDPTPWVAVVPGASPRDLPATARRVWLAPGFPALDRPPPSGPIAVASLIRQLDAELAAGVALTVVVPAELNGLDAERLRLSRTVAWRIADGQMARGVAPAAMPPTALVVRYAAGRAAGLRYLRAAAATWQPPGHAPAADIAPSAQALPPGSAPLVWLVPGQVPAAVIDRVRRGGIVLLDAAAAVTTDDDSVWRDPLGATLMSGTRLGGGRLLRWHRPLDPAAMPVLLDADFAERLAEVLAPPRPEPGAGAARDVAPLTGGPAFTPPARDPRPWLALAIAVVFLIERLLATARRRTAA